MLCLSAAYCNRCMMQAGDKIQFNWTFVGVIGNQTCYNGDTVIYDCKSGIKVTALLASTPTEFKVVFEDVCGHQKEAKFTYSAAGVTGMSKTDIPITSPGGVTVTPHNAATAAVPGFLATVGAGLLMAALL